MSVEDNMETILVDSGDEDQAEEETENCGGVPCTPTEKGVFVRNLR